MVVVVQGKQTDGVYVRNARLDLAIGDGKALLRCLRLLSHALLPLAAGRRFRSREGRRRTAGLLAGVKVTFA
jgi:hypothetical protein